MTELKSQAEVKEFVEDALANGAKPFLAAKSARIKARPAKAGEVVVTKTANGVEETKNTAKEGDMIAKNPGGEEYIINAATFAKKYEVDPSNPEQYRPKGGAQKFITLKDDLSFPAPWGEQMNIKAGGVLNISNLDDIYGIQKEEFKDTYKRCDKDGNIFNPAVLDKTR